jgi:D-methionine transport system substrate-binding protein
MNKYRLIVIAAFVIIVIVIIALFTRNRDNTTIKKEKSLVFGFVAGPYSDLFRTAIKPGLEKKGYEVKIIVFNDPYVPYNALNKKEIDAMLTGHTRAINFQKKVLKSDISPLISVPTAPMGLYSKTLKSRNLIDLKKELKKGDIITICDDPTNLPRTLIFLEKLGLIKLKSGIDRNSYMETDIVENPYGLIIKTLNSAQLPRSLENVTLSAIWGSIAIDADIFSSNITLETIEQDNLNAIAVRIGDLNKTWVKDLVSVIQSEEFKNVIENPKNQYNLFQRPTWYIKEWTIKNN